MNDMSISSINNKINGFLNSEDFDTAKIWELSNFINHNLRKILQQTEILNAKDLQANLLALSNKINNVNTPLAHELSFNIMGLAIGLFSAEKNNYLHEEIPSEVFSIIVDNLNPHNLVDDIRFLKSIKRTSTKWNKEIHAHILRRINEKDLSPSVVGCKTGSAAINYIIKNKLQSANLSYFSDIRDEDLRKLIENCPDLHTLFLESNKIKKVSLEKLTALKNLDLSYCMRLSGDKLALGKLTALKSLKLRWCTPLSEDQLTALGKLIALQSLELSGCRQFSEDKLAEALGKLTALKSLNLRECEQLSGDKLAEALGKLIALQSLDLEGCKQLSGDKLIKALGKLTALQSLNLERCRQLSGDELAEALGKLTALKNLDLERCTQLSEDKLAAALGKLTALQRLSLVGCDQLSGDKLAEALCKLTTLKSLNLVMCPQLKGNKLIIEAFSKLKARGVRIIA